MATNRYFNSFPSQQRINNEHLLLEDIVVESIQIMGHNVYFIPRESLDNIDMIFGETTKVRLHHAYMVEAYLANVEGYEGDNNFFSKFGLEIRQTSNFIISRRSFRKIVPSTLRERPQEGDLVYVPVFHKMFEIKFVEHELLFHSLGKRLPYIYELRCEAFRYSEEQIDTGIEEVDQIEEDNAYTIRIQLDKTHGSGDFAQDEVVFQSPDRSWANSTASGNVKEWYKSNGSLFIFNVSGEFANNTNVYSNTSSTWYKISGKDTTSDLQEYDISNNQDMAGDNTLVLDMSELNPFGVP